MKLIIVWLLIGSYSTSPSGVTVSSLYDQGECQRLGEQLNNDGWIRSNYKCYAYELRRE